MRICLVNPKSSESIEFSIPHGLLQLSAELKKNGHECSILNCNALKTPLDFGALSRFDIVGLSVMTTQLRQAVEIADKLRNKTHVVWGGIHCLLDPESILHRFPNDIVVSGDGEIPLLKIVDFYSRGQQLENLHNVSGICFFDKKPVINLPSFIKNLDDLTDVNFYDLPDFEQYIPKKVYYFTNKILRVLTILTSRGCSWDCSFCINSILRKYKAFHRTKSIEKIKRETSRIIDAQKIRFVYPMDEDFFVNRKFVQEWTAYALEKGFLWGANARYNYFNERIISKNSLTDLKQKNLFYVGMSIEAGTEVLRNSVINKQVADTDILKTVETFKASVGDTVAINSSFIINFPGDTIKNRIETIKWMDYLSKNVNITFSGPQIYRPYPGSRLYNLQKNNRTGNLDFYLDCILQSGALKTSKKEYYASFFYSYLVVKYFNTRFHFYTLNETSNDYHIAKKSNRDVLIKIFLSAFFVPIRLRIILRCWLFFIEPYIFGFVFKKIIDGIGIAKALTRQGQ
ncbi:MAG: cobalamin-dependent protein [Candidatus Pacebacteria bacterium]|nr:cobalamin-dependent protein [Candidatus Paceibacterota bacterium]